MKVNNLNLNDLVKIHNYLQELLAIKQEAQERGELMSEDELEEIQVQIEQMQKEVDAQQYEAKEHPYEEAIRSEIEGDID